MKNYYFKWNFENYFLEKILFFGVKFGYVVEKWIIYFFLKKKKKKKFWRFVMFIFKFFVYIVVIFFVFFFIFGFLFNDLGCNFGCEE